MSNIDLSRLVTAEDKARVALDAKMATSVGRYAFCNGLASAGVISDDEAIAAARGYWPASMDAFLSFLDDGQARDVQIEWAACVTVVRGHPFVLSLASWLTLTDAQVDALFGIEP